MKSTDTIKLTVLLTLSILTSVSLAQLQSTHESDNSERWEQNFLYTVKDAYLLNAGEARLSAQGSYWQNLQIREYESGTYKRFDRDQYLGIVGLEIGLTPGLQADVALPFGYAKHSIDNRNYAKGDAGDIQAGLSLQLIQQDHTSWTPTVSVRGGAIIALSNSQRGFDKGACGWETELLASKAFDDFFWHGNLSYRLLTNTREFAQSGRADEQLWKAGLALVYSPKLGYETMCEISYGSEREDNAVETEHREACYFTPGFNIELSPNTRVGVGIPIGLAHENYDWAFLAKVQIEL